MKFKIIIAESKVERYLGSNKNIKSNINEFIPITMDKNLVSIMKKWKVITKSPFSDSFYDITNKSWEDDFNQSFYRVADHWNFRTSFDDKIHCQTDKPVKNNQEWVLAKFDPKTKIYKVVKIFDYLIGLQQNHHDETGFNKEKAEEIFNYLPIQIPMTQNQIKNQFGDVRKEIIHLVKSKKVKMEQADKYNKINGSAYQSGSTLIYREK